MIRGQRAEPVLRRRPFLVILLSLTSLLLTTIPTARAQEYVHYVSTWGGTNYDSVGGVAIDSQGNTYVAGGTNSFGGSYDAVLLKYNSTGGFVWEKVWGGGSSDAATGVAVAPSGDLYVVGNTNSFGSGQSDIFILRFDQNGNLVSQAVWGGTQNDQAYGVKVGADGSVYVVGNTDSFGTGGFDQLVLKFDSAGSLVWQKTWGGAKPDYVRGMGMDASGNVYVAGSTNSTGTGLAEASLLKFDSGGTLLWQRTWGGSGNEALLSASPDQSGGSYFAGYTTSFGAGVYDALILHLDSNGYLLWEKTWGTSIYEFANDVTSDKSGNAYVVGSVASTIVGGDDNAFLLKLSATGILSSQLKWGSTTGQKGRGVGLDPEGNAVVVGDTSGPGPYSISSSAATLGTPSFTLATPSFALATPFGTVGSVSGTVSTPSASTSYAGGSDIFLFSYGLPDIGLITTASPTAIPAGQTSTITIRATSQGSAVSGVTITMSSSTGIFNPATGTTNTTGYFTTTYTPTSVTNQFTIAISVNATKPGYNNPPISTVNLTVTPPPPSTAPSLDPATLGIILAVVAAAILATVLLFRRRKRTPAAVTAVQATPSQATPRN